MNEEAARERVEQYQQYQQQLQSVMVQKESMQLQLMEIERTLEELNNTKSEKAYKITGQIMVIKQIEELKTELAESKEAIEIRSKSLDRTEEKITSRMKELETELKQLVK